MGHKMWMIFAKRKKTGEGLSDWNLSLFSFILILTLYMEAAGQFLSFYTMLCLKFHSFHENLQPNQLQNGSDYSVGFPMLFPDCPKSWEMAQTFGSSEIVDYRK